MRKYFDLLLFLLLAALPARVAAYTVVTTANAYMVENTSGTDPSGTVCYDFQTRPGCRSVINNLILSTGSLPSGSTTYIQNTLTPTTTTQQFSVQGGTVTNTLTLSTAAINRAILLNSQAGSSGQFIKSQGANLPPIWGGVSGQINQIVAFTNTTSSSTTNQNPINSSTNFTITPLSAGSTIYIYTAASAEVACTPGSANTACGLTLRWARANVALTSARVYRNAVALNSQVASLADTNTSTVAMFDYDFPATTSAVTYTLQINAVNGVETALSPANPTGGSGTTSGWAIEIGP